jgi:hypothetical protein
VVDRVACLLFVVILYLGEETVEVDKLLLLHGRISI